MIMQTAISRQEDGTIELTVTVPWKKVKENFDKFFAKAVSGVEVEGFRKGKAPKKLAEDKVDKEKVYQEMIKEIIPLFYLEAVKEHNLRPIISPKVELLNAKEDQDWQFKASLCEKPKVTLGNYKKAILELKRQKATKIWVPGEKEEKKKEKNKGPTLDEILDTLLKEVQVRIPEILLGDQVNHLLADLLDQTRKLGLTIDQYLKAKGETVKQLQDEYRIQAERALSLEFALEEIADQEKITVEEKEIDEIINKEKDEKIRTQLKGQKYYLASLLRRQKTLNSLATS